jgi:hypothetical protein
LRNVPSKLLDTNDDAAPDFARVGLQEGNLWAWFRYSHSEEGQSCIRPADIALGEPGRWLKQRLPIGIDCGSNRYLAHVDYCANQVSSAMLIDRCRGKYPAVFVSLVDDEISPDMETQTYAYHKVVGNYRVRVISANWHGGTQARFGGPQDAGQDGDPGSLRILGDIRQVLIYDNKLMGALGVVKTTLGGLSTNEQRDAERLIFDSMTVRVIGYMYTPNTPCELVAPWQFWVQLQDAAGQNQGPVIQVPGHGETA